MALLEGEGRAGLAGQGPRHLLKLQAPPRQEVCTHHTLLCCQVHTCRSAVVIVLGSYCPWL